MANALNKVNSGGIEDGSIVNADVSASAAITYSKLQDVSATDRILGRDSSGAGDIEEITPANVRTMLNVEDGADVTDATNVNAAGAVMNADVDAKGDLLVGTADNTVAALTSSGTNDHVLTVDTSTATGLKWAAAAGGATINNATENELVTVASTTTQLDAEAKLTFDGTNLFIGGGGSRTVAGNSHRFVIEDTGAAPTTAMGVISNTNGADGPAIRLGKTRATTLGGNTATNTDDNLGQIEWMGNDGSALRVAGRLRVKQESDTDTNSVPGYMQFMVTGDGETNPYEHMRLRAGPTGTDGRLIIAPPITNNGNATDGWNQGEINLSNWNINQDDRYARIYSYNSGNNYTIGVKFQSGKTGTTWMNIKGNAEIDGNFNDTSDIALKENVVALSSTWNAVKQLKPCTFDWKPQTDVKDSSKVIVDGWSSVGFIAQEVESVIPLLVSGKDGEKSINTIGLVSQLTKALQEAMTKIETLETKVAALEAK